MEEVHNTPYTVHLDNTKMYLDFKTNSQQLHGRRLIADQSNFLCHMIAFACVNFISIFHFSRNREFTLSIFGLSHAW